MSRLNLLLGAYALAAALLPVGAQAAPKPTTPSTPAQERAFANPLHQTHLDAEDPSQCADCHRVEGPGRTQSAVRHRCLSCHEDSASGVHRKVADRDAQECQSCHDFLSKEADPWACVQCHRPGGQREGFGQHALQVTKLRREAPKAKVHVERCDACHEPHGQDPLAPGDCGECHEKSRSHHHRRLDGPEQCLECHSGHAPARAARSQCTQCHSPGRQTLFEDGHDSCLDCHRPHAARDPSCTRCHEMQALFRPEDAHERCVDCHTPHRPKQLPDPQCAECHAPVLEALRHPSFENGGRCTGCHPQHPEEGAAATRGTCVECHDSTSAGSERPVHGGADCASCHAPHAAPPENVGGGMIAIYGASLKAEHPLADARCAKCHESPREEIPAIAAIEGHAECSECHRGSAHAPKAQLAECGGCHEKIHPDEGHRDCLDCHDAHRGEVKKDCLGCHEVIAESRHELLPTDCGECHGPHATAPRPSASACHNCHDPAPLLHASSGHAECTDCHGFHDTERIGDRAGCLDGCHAESSEHESTAESCIGCHPFEKAPKGRLP